jgi:hypothetical protein
MMPNVMFALLALFASLAAGPGISTEARTLSPVAPETKGVNLIFNQRIVAAGRIVLLSRTVQPDGSVSYSQREYQMDGTPVATWQDGFWSDRWNHFETRYGREGAAQKINETTNRTELPARAFRDPTVLWFWRTYPKVNDTIVVTYLAQNVIATSQIRFTYEGDEQMTLAGRTVTVHRVREDPVGAQGVYTLWWYDDQGMGVKRFHKTTQHEYTDELVAWQ